MNKYSYDRNALSTKEIIWRRCKTTLLCVGAALGILNVVGLSNEKSARQTVLDHGYSEPVHIGKAGMYTCKDSFYRDVFNAKTKDNKNVQIVVCYSILEQRNYIRL